MPTPKPAAKRPLSPASPVSNRPADNLKASLKALSGKNIRQEFSVLAGDVKKSFLGYVQQFEKFRDIVKNNYELGRYHLEQGNLKDALLRLKFVLWLNPAHVDAMYYLGATCLAMGNRPQAVQWFGKVLKLRPTFEEARYMYCVASKKPISGTEMPKTMPRKLAVEYFDSIAADYDVQQLELLHYEGHIQLINTLRPCLTPGRMDHLVLDLGVGTGLCGPGIRDVAAHLTGVDISGRMLDEAVNVVDNKDKKIYDALIKREAVDFLSESPDASYDIVMSAGMFSYLGDLEPVFAQISRVVKDKGFFAYTAEVLGEEAMAQAPQGNVMAQALQGNVIAQAPQGWRFEPSDARFHYARPYLQELAARYGFKEQKLKDLAVYADIPAWIAVYQKNV